MLLPPSRTLFTNFSLAQKRRFRGRFGITCTFFGTNGCARSPRLSALLRKPLKHRCLRAVNGFDTLIIKCIDSGPVPHILVGAASVCLCRRHPPISIAAITLLFIINLSLFFLQIRRSIMPRRICLLCYSLLLFGSAGIFLFVARNHSVFHKHDKCRAQNVNHNCRDLPSLQSAL